MPEHTSFLSYLVAMFPALGENMHNFGNTFLGHKPVDAHGAEPIAASVLVALLIILLALGARSKITNYEESVIPDEKLSLRTFFEIFVGYFYNMMKDMMGPTRAKRYFPDAGTASLFILFSNFLGMIPGFLPPTSSWNITAGMAVVVLFTFTIYGLQAQGFGFISHLAGPWMGPLMLPINILGGYCLVGVLVYVFYGFWNSKLAKGIDVAEEQDLETVGDAFGHGVDDRKH